MKEQPLVSVITPCYNGETYMSRMLDSMLSQDYNNVEFFFINDGSTDKTNEILLKYKPLLENKFTKFIYINKKKNEGVCAAFNSVLQKVSGKYLMWPDSDDILYSNFISTKVNFMESNTQYGLCCCCIDYADEENITNITHSTQRVVAGKDNLFEDFILERNNAMGGPALAYFVRTQDWINSNPKRQIYNNRLAANWQMLLPIMYHSKCGYINKKLARCIERHQSASRAVADWEKRWSMHKDILYNTLKDINMTSKDFNKYNLMIKRKYQKKLIKAKLKSIPLLGNILKYMKGIIK